MEQSLKKYHCLFFLGLAVLLLYPTFRGGYIFLLDWMVEPNISLVDINPSIDSIGWISYKLGAIIFSFDIFQRIFLFATVYFLGMAGFRLAARTGNVFAQYFAGLLLVFNPFMYARLVEQPGVALGSVLFFWFLVYLLEYLEEGGRVKILAAAFFGALAVSILTHSIFFIATVSFLLLFFDYWERRDWKFSLKTISIIFGIIIVLNANWLFSFTRGDAQGVGGIQDFGSADVETFHTRGLGGDSVYFTVLSLQGYWGEYQDRFVSIRENPLWEPALIALLLLVVFGLIRQLANKDRFAKPLLIAAIVSYILAIGIASPIFAPLANFLYAHFPFYIGLRESQKWVVILVFFYAYFGAWGIVHFLKWERIRRYRYEWSLIFVLLPILFAYPSIRGMHEHFTPHDFPAEWQEAKDYLGHNGSGKVLFFPWHSYAKLDFAGKNVAVPALAFFGKNIIQGNNTEFGKVYSHSLDQQTLAIEKYVMKKDNPAEKIKYGVFATDMQKIGIQTVMLAKTEDWQGYLWLDKISGVEKVMENDKLIIYSLK